MKKTLLGTNEDGSPHYLFEAEGDERIVVTGPIVAQLEVSDGTLYDVSDPVVGVKPEHHDELVDKIGQHYEVHGHPHHKIDPVTGVRAPFKAMSLADSRALTHDDLVDEHGNAKSAAHAGQFRAKSAPKEK